MPENPGCLEVSMGACDDEIFPKPDVMSFVVFDLFNLFAVVLGIV